MRIAGKSPKRMGAGGGGFTRISRENSEIYTGGRSCWECHSITQTAERVPSLSPVTQLLHTGPCDHSLPSTLPGVLSHWLPISFLVYDLSLGTWLSETVLALAPALSHGMSPLAVPHDSSSDPSLLKTWLCLRKLHALLPPPETVGSLCCCLRSLLLLAVAVLSSSASQSSWLLSDWQQTNPTEAKHKQTSSQNTVLEEAVWKTFFF